MIIHQENASVELDPRDVARLEQAVFRGEGRRLRVSLHVVGDEEIARVHADHMGVAGTTDVITFDLSGDGPGAVCPEDVDGEIVVNAELASREARERGHEPAAELLFYVAHGLLHLLGYDDATDLQREAMLALQAKYIAEAGRKLES